MFSAVYQILSKLKHLAAEAKAEMKSARRSRVGCSSSSSSELDSLSRSPPPASFFLLSSHTAVYLFSGGGGRRLISYITTFNTQLCHYAINTKGLSDSVACRRVFGFFQWAAEC